MTEIIALPIDRWDRPSLTTERQDVILALEAGKVLFFPRLRFAIMGDETKLLSSTITGRAKNISLDPARGTIRGSQAGETESGLLRSMMTRFAVMSAALLHNLLPSYEADLRQARTSYRPIEIAGRSSSWRKDDTRLHIDSFPSSPTQGKRILRVFANVNPHGRPRTWRIGEPFENVARRYLPLIPRPIRGSELALELLGITKSRRSPYDHYMLHLHDWMKADQAYQAQAAQRYFEFPAASTWAVFTDQVSHAAVSGQYALEQTFHLPVQAMLDPSQSPLRVLERLLGRQLT